MVLLLPNEMYLHTSVVTSPVWKSCNNIRLHRAVWAGVAVVSARVNTMWDCWNQSDVLIGRSHSLAAKEKGWVVGCAPEIRAQCTHSPLITHKHPHPLFQDVQVFRNVWKGSSGRCLVNSNGPWNVKWSGTLPPPVFCRYDSLAASCFDVFSVWTAGWEIVKMRHPQMGCRMSAETLLWRTSKVLQQVDTFLVVWLAWIPCHQTPWPCHPGRDVRTHSHLRTLLHHVSQD